MEFFHARINPLNKGDPSSDALVKSDLSPLAIIAG
jgi:hypothetical protein